VQMADATQRPGTGPERCARWGSALGAMDPTGVSKLSGNSANAEVAAKDRVNAVGNSGCYHLSPTRSDCNAALVHQHFARNLQGPSRNLTRPFGRRRELRSNRSVGDTRRWVCTLLMKSVRAPSVHVCGRRSDPHLRYPIPASPVLRLFATTIHIHHLRLAFPLLRPCRTLFWDFSDF